MPDSNTQPFDPTGGIGPFRGPDRLPPDRLPPAPYMSREDKFHEHYVWHLAEHARMGKSGRAARPTLGELVLSTGISRRRCQELRTELEEVMKLG